MKYAPEPTADQLSALATEFAPGGSVSFDHRILGGLGCTMDVLAIRDRSGASFKSILRRRGMWSHGESLETARTELDVLRLLQAHDIPVPEPLWLDEHGIFSEPASMITFVDGVPLMKPEDPIDYTTQLAQMLVRLHDVKPGEKIRSDLIAYNEQAKSFVSSAEPPERIAGHHLGAELWAARRAELDKTDLAPAVFVHGDYWPGNTLWKDQQLIAVVDFEEIGLGDPALDVATAIVNYRFEPWREAEQNFRKVYQGETGRSLDSLRFWSMKELMRPMPDIGRWLPSFKEMSSNPGITLEELRSLHDGLILEELDR